MSKAWKIFLSIVAAVLLLFAVAEAGIRTFVAHQVTSQAPENTSVSFGSNPVTLGLLGGTFPHIEVSQPSTLLVNGNEITGTPESTVNMDRVRLTGGEPVAQSLRLTTTLPNDFIRAMLNQQLEQQLGQGSFLSNIITVSDVSTDDQAGTFTISFTAGAAGIELAPVMDSGRLEFQARSTELFGFELPQDVATAITEAMAEGVSQEATGGMQVEDFQVVPGGLKVTVFGENVNFNELQQLEAPAAYQS